MSKVVALIPARGGSKGIKHKNIIPLAGKPLIAYTIQAAKDCRSIGKVYTSSDDQQILAVAEQEGSELICRHPLLAQDSTPTNPVIDEFIVKAGLVDEDIIVLLQPTSPMRTYKHIDAAFALFKSHPNASALISVCAADSKYLYAYSGANPYLTPLFPEALRIARRQDLPAIYLPNGAIYIFSVAAFKREQKIPDLHVIAYVMPEHDSIDIDSLDDLKRAEFLLGQTTRD